MDTSCREGNASIGSTLYIYDNSTSYYYGTQLYSEEVDLSKYSNLTFKYTLNGTSGGTETQYRQQAAYLSINNTNIWGIDYKLSNLSGTKTINSLNYEKASVKFFMYSGGLTQYQTNFSVPYIYFY